MTSPNGSRLAAQDFARRFRLRVFGAIGVLALLMFASAARADAVDDTLAKFLDDKFPQTEAAIGELAAEAPPQAAAILEAPLSALRFIKTYMLDHANRGFEEAFSVEHDKAFQEFLLKKASAAFQEKVK